MGIIWNRNSNEAHMDTNQSIIAYLASYNLWTKPEVDVNCN